MRVLLPLLPLLLFPAISPGDDSLLLPTGADIHERVKYLPELDTRWEVRPPRMQVLWSPFDPGARPTDLAVAVGARKSAATFAVTSPNARAVLWLVIGQSSPVPVEELGTGDDREPFLSFAGDAARPSLLWVNRNAEREALLLMEPSGGSEWSTSVITATTGGSTMETPSLLHFADGTPAVLWCEVSGSTSDVYAAWREDDQWRAERLSEGRFPYDILPQWHEHPAPRAFWFAWDEGAFGVRSRGVPTNGEGTARWDELARSERLPVLQTLPGHDRPDALRITSSAESGAQREMLVVPFHDDVLVTSTAGRFLDPNLTADGAAGWIVEDERGRTLELRRDSAYHSAAVGPAARHLQVASRNTAVAAVWLSDPADGGDGAVWMLDVVFPPIFWEDP